MDQEFLNFIINAFLFFLAYKVGQLSIIVKNIKEVNKPTTVLQNSKLKIRIEEINGMLYAYDGNDFLAQAKTADELGLLIAERFPQKYRLAKIEFKT